jgi:hypothetical protein
MTGYRRHNAVNAMRSPSLQIKNVGMSYREWVGQSSHGHACLTEQNTTKTDQHCLSVIVEGFVHRAGCGAYGPAV